VSKLTTILAALVSLTAVPARAAVPEAPLIVGRAVNPQNLPIAGMRAELVVDGEPTGLVATTRSDGYFIIEVELRPGRDFRVALNRRHFAATEVALTRGQMVAVDALESVFVGTVMVTRSRSAGFWVTLAVFILMMVLIGATPMHNSLASLLGASLLLATSALGPLYTDDLVVFTFPEAIDAVDWNVVFLIMGMMIVIAVVEGTGLFRWLAFFAYKISGGRLWKLMLILMVLTAVSSAFLDNVTTMLLMTPITIRIALAIDTDPLVLLMPEIMAANIGGLATMVGTPTNILIASYSGISFSQFLINLTPGVLLALGGVAAYSLLLYRRQMKSGEGAVSANLLARLEAKAVIAQPAHLRKAGWVGLVMVALFIFGESLHIPPAVIALMGATALLVWIRPDVEEMIEAVDWTTLVFFITLFMVVGALREVGFIDQIAVWVGWVVGDNWFLTMFVITWLAALTSTVIPNIPFTATMLPVVGYLTATVPGAHPEALFFCLAVGAAMGGNGSLIGASANLVAAGIAERSGHPITFGHFFRVGFPALLISVSLSFLWLMVRFVVLEEGL